MMHPAALNNLKHETLIDMHKRLSAAKWCEKKFGKRWDPFDNPAGRWTMIWEGHDSDLRDQRKLEKYRVCFEDEQDLFVFRLTCP
jgi:hypothetical protein